MSSTDTGRETYDLGDLVVLTGRFYSDAALTTPANPDTVSLTIRSPAGTITTPTPIVHGSTGVYTYDWTPPAPGLYEVRWAGTGAVVSVDQQPIFISTGLDVGIDLCTLEDVRLALELETRDRDALIQTCITAASRAIARRYQRQFAVLGVQTFAFEACGTLIDLAPCDLQDTVDLAITLDPGGDSETLLASTDFKLRPARSSAGTYYRVRLARTLSLPSTSSFGFFDVSITGTWGFPAIDEDVRRACVITASAWLDRSVATYELPDVGANGMNYVPARASTWAIPAAAHTLLVGFERMVVA
jgi:hypothetical protein